MVSLSLSIVKSLNPVVGPAIYRMEVKKYETFSFSWPILQDPGSGDGGGGKTLDLLLLSLALNETSSILGYN